MDNSNILLRPFFWYAFIALVILVLFIYGMRIDHDKTELQETKTMLQQKEIELSASKTEVDNKSSQITELNKIVSERDTKILELSNALSLKDTAILRLQDTITELRNRPPETITKFQDRVLYQDKPDTYHPYGKGYGKLTIYSECNACPGIKVTVDGEDWGTLRYYFSGEPNCAQDGTISKVVLAGKHHVQGKDGNNRSWDYYTIVKEDKCNFWHYSY